MLAYIYDFLSILFDKVKERDKIRRIILFGSHARGNYRKDSDVDIFIDVLEKNKAEIQELVRESLNEFELKSSKTWKLRGINNPIMPITDDIDLEKWKELRIEISNYGLALYGEFTESSAKDKESVLIEYDLSRIKQKDKVGVLRRLYGYKIRKGKKLYIQKGIVEETGAEKISNSVLVKKRDYLKVVELLRENKIPIKIRGI